MVWLPLWRSSTTSEYVEHETSPRPDGALNHTLQVLVDGPSANTELAVPRQSVPLAKCLLSQFVVEGLLRGSRNGTVKKLWEKCEIDTKWEQSNWAKKRDQIKRRKNLTDFDRFKVMRLKKQRRFEERKAMAKIKASA